MLDFTIKKRVKRIRGKALELAYEAFDKSETP